MRPASSPRREGHLRHRRSAHRNPRVTLYRNPALRAVVDEHRARARDATTITGLAAQLAMQQLTLHALADRVRQHEEVIRKLSQPR